MTYEQESYFFKQSVFLLEQCAISKKLQVFEVLSFGLDTGSQWFCLLFIGFMPAIAMGIAMAALSYGGP